jgi:hypothetical protein
MYDTPEFLHENTSALPGASGHHNLTANRRQETFAVENNLLVALMTDPAALGIAATFYALMQFGGIYAAVHAVLNARSSQGATAWAIALLATPFIAVPLYLVLGRNRFHGYVRARRLVDANHADVIRQVNTFCYEYRSDLPGPRGTLHSPGSTASPRAPLRSTSLRPASRRNCC